MVSLVAVVVTVVCASAAGAAAASAAIKAEVRTSRIMAFPRALMENLSFNAGNESWFPAATEALKSLNP
jgi:hypothetical protein